MTRGKYSSRADARRAREELAVEVEQLRSAHRKLVNEHRSLKEAYDNARLAHVDESVRLRQQIATGTSDEVTELRKNIAVLETQLDRQFDELRQGVLAFFRGNSEELRLTTVGVERFCAFFGITAGEFQEMAGQDSTRGSRRRKAKKIPTVHEFHLEMAGRGLDAKGLR